MNHDPPPRRIDPSDLPPELSRAARSTPTPPAPRSPRSRATAGRPRPTAPGQTTDCACCGELLEAVELRRPDGQPYYMWSLCDRLREAWRISDERIARADAERRQAIAEQQLGDPGLSRIAHLLLDRFNPDRLRVQLGHDNPHTLVCDWLEAIRDAREGDYHRGPPVALFLHYPGKGTGKTHLAAGAALRARAWGKLAVFVEEESFIKRAWAAPFEDKERLAQLPGDLAWLTVVDDLSQNPGGMAVARTWYDIINRRWLRRGWTILTSNYTLEEMVERSTLSEAAYSRLAQMTRGQTVLVEADDQRLRGRP